MDMTVSFGRAQGKTTPLLQTSFTVSLGLSLETV